VCLAIALVAGCSSGRDTDAADASPTFHQIRNEALRFDKPLSEVSDVMAPVQPDQPWRIVGGILDPESGKTQAAVWEAAAPPDWKLTKVDPTDSDVSESMAAVAPVGSGLLAVGRIGEGANSDAAIWRNDGNAWRPLTPAVMGGRHEQWAFDLAVGDGGVLVAGGESIWGDVHPRLWFSPDGENWQSVDGGPGGPLDTTGEESVNAIAPFGTGFVAVGTRDVEGEQDGVAWFSADGITWEPADATLMGGPGRQSVQSAVAINGMLVAGGYQDNQFGQGQPVIWTSTDGRGWTPGPTQIPLNTGRSAANNLSVRALSVAGTNLVAIGGSRPQPMLWASPDAGATWNLYDDPVKGNAVLKDGVDLVDAATTADGGIVAIGSEPTVMGLRRDRWVDVAGDAFPKGGHRPQVSSVLADHDTLLAAGWDYTASQGDDQRQRYTGRLWRRDGGDINVVEPSEELPDLSAGQITDLAVFKGGYVAVGFEDFSVADVRNVDPVNGDSLPDGLLWTSADGKTWTRQAADYARPDPRFVPVGADQDASAPALVASQLALEQGKVTFPPAGGPGSRTLSAVAPLGDGFIAVGSVYNNNDGIPETPPDTDALVAVSGDGVSIAAEDPVLNGLEAQRLLDVCVGKDGSVVAVGMSETSGQSDVAIRHRGVDGIWGGPTTSDPTMAGPGDQQAVACAASDDGFLVVGTDKRSGNDDARVWSSSDGVNWQEIPAGALGGVGDQAADAVAPLRDGGWLVAGTDTTSGDSDVALWQIDKHGKITRRDHGEPSLAGPGEQTVESMAVAGNRVVIVGQDQTGIAIWETTQLDR
jgi:hypothetical protein